MRTRIGSAVLSTAGQDFPTTPGIVRSMFVMPYAFGALALVLIGIVLVGGYIEENRVYKITSACKPKKGCC